MTLGRKLKLLYLRAGFFSCLLNVSLLLWVNEQQLQGQWIIQLSYTFEPEEKREKPRIVYLPLYSKQWLKKTVNETLPAETLVIGTEKEKIGHGMPQPLCAEDTDCVVPGNWQLSNNRNCNLLHEIDLEVGREEDLRIVGKGGKRFVWKVREFDGSLKALKMFQLRPGRKDDFGPLTIELQRLDAIVHEVTASSPYIVNMYGYCSTSGLYEFGGGGELEENIVRDGPIPREDLLRIAHRVASSVADVQHFDDSDMPTIAHSDIHGQQWIMVNGEYQLTDFNLAKLLRRSATTNTTIPFRRAVVDNVSALVRVR